MADSKEIKFSEADLKSLQEVQQNYQEMQDKMGGLKMPSDPSCTGFQCYY